MSVHRTVVCLGVATGFLSVLCVLLAGLLAWRLVTEPLASEEGTTLTANLTEIKATFPGYFRTPQEQQIYEATMSNVVPKKGPVQNISTAYSCDSRSLCVKNVPPPSTPAYKNGSDFSTTTAPSSRVRRQVTTALPCALDIELEEDLSFHGCCISNSYQAVPDYLQSASTNPQQVQIAQFSGLNQYFEIEQCCQVRGCDGCQCSQTYYVTSAIVVKTLSNGGKRYESELVLVPGCCKCLNSDPSDSGSGEGNSA